MSAQSANPSDLMNRAQQEIAAERDAKSEPVKLLHVYWGTLPSINYIFPNGKPAIFVNNRFTTNIPYEIEHLDNEIKMGHPHIYKKPGEETMDAKYLDPMEAVRERIIADAIAMGLVTANVDRDMGTSDQTQKLNVQTSTDVAAASAGHGNSSNARLLDLAATLRGTMPGAPQ